ncbi:hypothetical protein B0T13DRAFT_327861 [Neurospora crassa]|nr:hypothetical protein B0T13DRAFT_327861 [Neurospora crassa]
MLHFDLKLSATRLARLVRRICASISTLCILVQSQPCQTEVAVYYKSYTRSQTIRSEGTFWFSPHFKLAFWITTLCSDALYIEVVLQSDGEIWIDPDGATHLPNSSASWLPDSLR